MGNTQQHYDLIIIGAGPIGLATGIELKRKGISFIIIEKGCIVNSIYNYPTNMTFFSTSDRLEIGGVPFISHGAKPTRREALEYYRRVVDAFKLPVKVFEEVQKFDKTADGFDVKTDKGTYSSQKLVIASGFYGDANMMNVPGEDLSKVKHYYDEPHPYAYRKVLVVGGGNSAVDAALETYRCNAEVHLLVREDKLKDGVKYWVRPDIENRIKEGDIKAYFNAELKEITETTVTLEQDGKLITLENDFVLAMTGYQPDYSLLEQLDIRFTEGDLKIPEVDETTQRTSVDGLYLAGVVCGGRDTSRWFIENARVHADKIAEDVEKSLKVLN